MGPFSDLPSLTSIRRLILHLHQAGHRKIPVQPPSLPRYNLLRQLIKLSPGLHLTPRLAGEMDQVPSHEERDSTDGSNRGPAVLPSQKISFLSKLEIS